MERARGTWTDERLDDLARRVHDGFNRVDEDIRGLRAELHSEMGSLRTELGARIDAQSADLGARIDAQGGRIDALQRTMLQVGGATIAAVLASVVSVLITQL